MIYNNDDYRALSAIDKERTEEDENKYCSVCGAENPEEFYVSIMSDECIGCSDCVDILEWIEL